MQILNSRKTILIIGYDVTGENQFFTNELAFRKWCTSELDAHMIANVVPGFVQVKPTTSTSIPAVVKKIKQEWKQIDGVVCILPSAHFLFAASQLAFEVGTAGKPIVCTTAQWQQREGVVNTPVYAYPPLRLHILNAVQLATADLSGVVLVGGSEVIPATHAITTGRDQRFVSADHVVYGHVDFGVRTTHHARPRSASAISPSAAQGSIAVIDASVGATPQVTAALRASAKQSGVVLLGGTAALRPALDAECSKTLPVLIQGEGHASLREKGKWSSIDYLTPATAAAKFIWLLQHRKTHPLARGPVVRGMETDVIGEILL